MMGTTLFVTGVLYEEIVEDNGVRDLGDNVTVLQEEIAEEME